MNMFNVDALYKQSGPTKILIRLDLNVGFQFRQIECSQALCYLKTEN